MPTFAENNVNYTDGQINVQAPPDSVLLSGFIPEQAGTRGQPLPAQWLNYLFRQLYRYVNRVKMADASGVGLFPYADCTISLQAVDSVDTTKFMYAIGYRTSLSVVPYLRVVNGSGLSLGTPTISGTYPILGGSATANVKLTGISNPVGDF